MGDQQFKINDDSVPHRPLIYKPNNIDNDRKECWMGWHLRDMVTFEPGLRAMFAVSGAITTGMLSLSTRYCKTVRFSDGSVCRAFPNEPVRHWKRVAVHRSIAVTVLNQGVVSSAAGPTAAGSASSSSSAQPSAKENVILTRQHVEHLQQSDPIDLTVGQEQFLRGDVLKPMLQVTISPMETENLPHQIQKSPEQDHTSVSGVCSRSYCCQACSY